MYVVRLKSDDAYNKWIENGAKPVPDEPLYVLVKQKPSDSTDVIRIGQVRQYDNQIAFATNRLLIDFDDVPQKRETVLSIVGTEDIMDVEPLEPNSTEDYTWVIYLNPKIDPDVKALTITHDKVSSVEPDRIHMGKYKHLPIFH